MGFTNPVGTQGVLDVCPCFGCGDVGGVGGVSGEWVGDLNQGLVGWGGVMSGLSVYMAGPGIYVLCLPNTCPSEVHPMFNSVALDGYLLPYRYLFIADITNPDSFV